MVKNFSENQGSKQERIFVSFKMWPLKTLSYLFVNRCDVTLEIARSLEAVVAQIADEVVAFVNASEDQFNKKVYI